MMYSRLVNGHCLFCECARVGQKYFEFFALSSKQATTGFECFCRNWFVPYTRGLYSRTVKHPLQIS